MCSSERRETLMTGTGCQLLADWGPGGPQLQLGHSGVSGWIVGKTWGAREAQGSEWPKWPRDVFTASLSMLISNNNSFISSNIQPIFKFTLLSQGYIFRYIIHI